MQRVRERESFITDLLGKCPQLQGLSQAKPRSQEIPHGLSHGCQEAKYLTIICCIPSAISRNLNQKLREDSIPGALVWDVGILKLMCQNTHPHGRILF